MEKNVKKMAHFIIFEKIIIIFVSVSPHFLTKSLNIPCEAIIYAVYEIYVQERP